MPAMSEGGMIADVIAAVASIDPVMGGVRPMTTAGRQPEAIGNGHVPGRGRLGAGGRRPVAARPRLRRGHAAAQPRRSSPGTRSRARRCCRCCTSCSRSRATSARTASASAPSALELTTAEVSAVATFYTMYKRTPCGEHLVSVCTNTLCAALGGDDIYRRLAGEARRRPRGDGRGARHAGSITLEHAECLAACDLAPVLQVNYEYFDNQTVEYGRGAGRRPAAAASKPHPTRGAAAHRLPHRRAGAGGHLPGSRRGRRRTVGGT